MDYALCLAKQATKNYVANCQLRERPQVGPVKGLLICVILSILTFWLLLRNNPLKVWKAACARCCIASEHGGKSRRVENGKMYR